MANADSTLRTDSHKTAYDFIKEAEDIAVRWWTILNEAHARGEFPKFYQANDSGKHEDIDKHRDLLNVAKEMICLAEGKEPSYRYEVWTSRNIRLEGSFEFAADAHKEKDKWLAKYPDAFVTKSHIRSSSNASDDLSLLNTLVGRVRWAGTWCAQDGEIYDTVTVQDDTGRCVNIRSDLLIEHPIWSSLTDNAKERIKFDFDRADRKANHA